MMNQKKRLNLSSGIFVIFFILLFLSWFFFKGYFKVQGLWIFTVIIVIAATHRVIFQNYKVIYDSGLRKIFPFNKMIPQESSSYSRQAWIACSIISLFYLIIGLYSIYNIILCMSLITLKTELASSSYLIPFLLTGFLALFATRDADSKLEESPNLLQEKVRYVSLLRALVSLSFLLVLNHIIQIPSDPVFKYLSFCGHYISLLVHIFILLIGIELILFSLRSSILLFRKKAWSLKGPSFFTASFFFSTFNPVKSVKKGLTDLLGIDLFKTHASRYLFSIVEPLFISAVLVFWLMTAFVIIPPHKQGIQERYQKIISKRPLMPGIHIKFPWPIDKIKLFSPEKIEVKNIGFIPSKDKKHIIWTKPHAAENFNLVLGNGLEMISVDCQVYYKINDLIKYVKNFQNPELLIESAAYRALTFETVGSTFDQVMIRDRSNFSLVLQDDIQNILNRMSSGIEIVQIVFLALHPPIELANAYEDVISSQIDMKTRVLAANADREYSIAMAKASALNIINRARSYLKKNSADAYGGSSSFLSRTAAFRVEPELVRFRMRLEKMKRAMSSKRLYIVDESVLTNNNSFFLDLRGKGD